MKNFKKLVAVVAAVGVLGTVGAAFAATAIPPADIAAGVTGKTVEDVAKERAAGKTYGSIANEAGKLEEFKTKMLEQRKAVLEQRVKDGSLTQQEADKIYSAIESNQAICDANGSAGTGMKYGAGFGSGGCGMSNGQGRGAGQGMGAGRGLNR